MISQDTFDQLSMLFLSSFASVKHQIFPCLLTESLDPQAQIITTVHLGREYAFVVDLIGQYGLNASADSNSS